jgi:hypothetical protein
MNKIENFINNANFTVLSHDITNKQHQNVRNYINNSQNFIKPNDKWRYSYKYDSQSTTYTRNYKIT